ncbi:MAG: helix-turn-helix domain-containing protein [Candidatus Hydrogenedentes bacterium]|nr:helix-turn-helix domain-containing protein [Candidatus Hydrogenedentota bacterium]
MSEDFSQDQNDARLIDVQGVAALLGCCTRSVYRFADMGRIPRPIKLGHLVRWDRQVLDKWISDGCPDMRERRRSNK